MTRLTESCLPYLVLLRDLYLQPLLPRKRLARLGAFLRTHALYGNKKVSQRRSGNGTNGHGTNGGVVFASSSTNY